MAKSKELPRPRPKFVMPPPNDDLHDRGMRLWDVRVLQCDRAGRLVCDSSDTPLGGEELWLEPRILLRLCDASPTLQKALAAAAKAQYSVQSRKHLKEQLTKLFEEEYIVKLLNEFDVVATYLVDYLLARRSCDEFEKQTATPPTEEPVDAHVQTEDHA